MRYYPDSTPIQEGAPAVYGQAHPDPTDHDGFASVASFHTVEHSNNPQSEPVQPSVNVRPHQGIAGQLPVLPQPTANISRFAAVQQPARNLSPVQCPAVQSPVGSHAATNSVPQAGLSFAIANNQNRQQDGYMGTPWSPDGNLMLHNEGSPYAQSASGFSQFQMNVPSGRHPRQPEPAIEVPPNYQDVGKGCRGTEHSQPRPEFEPPGCLHGDLQEQEGTIRPFVKQSGPDVHPQGSSLTSQGNRMPGSNNYVTANQEHLTHSPLSFPQSRQLQGGRDVEQIHHPHYRHVENRKKSFNNWPKSNPQSPERLVAAGLFYSGKGDQCHCFHCNGVLRRWERDDDPMEEHELWYPECPYVKELRRTRHETVAKTTGAIGGLEQNMQKLSLEATDKIKMLEGMGFSRKDIIKALEKVGTKDVDIDDILEYLLKMTRGSDQISEVLPPQLDPNVCGVCNRHQVSVIQLWCRHIVCYNCRPKRGLDGKFRCSICGKEVTRTVAYDSSNFN